ncbi:MAG: hypothetical protein ACNA7G_12520 [Methylobacter sp.]
MFEIDRTFCQRSAETGLMEWFFYAREGVYGPFLTKEKAEGAVKKFIKFNVAISDSGGRNSAGKAALSLAPMANVANAIKLDGTKTKLGKDGLLDD